MRWPLPRAKSFKYGAFHVKHFTIRSMGLAFGLVLTLAALGIGLSGCSTAQTDKFVGGITNFTRGVAAVDEAVGKISATLYKNCKSIQAVAQAADDITGQCSKASPVVSAGNAIINSYCQRDQVTDIASAVSATAATVSSTKSQLSAAKQSCAKGGG